MCVMCHSSELLSLSPTHADLTAQLGRAHLSCQLKHHQPIAIGAIKTKSDTVDYTRQQNPQTTFGTIGLLGLLPILVKYNLSAFS